jgi:hypothetical protein
MTDIDKLLQEESDAIEANPDAPVMDSTKVSRPGMERAKVLSVRLNPEEYENLRRLAAASGVGPSTMARGLILQGLVQPTPSPLEASLAARIAALEEWVASH